MLQNPDVSQTQIVFAYAGDLWVVAREGGTAVRLSSPAGQEMFPHFSPDGTSIAYSANYDGNGDIYVVPAAGGTPVRVTNHGMYDRVLGWYPDGSKILFSSGMNSGRQRFSQFYSVAPTGGMPAQLPVPYGEFGAISPDGKAIAYTPRSRAHRTWKRYRGGTAPDIYLFDLDKLTARGVALDPANDEFPMWSGRKLYFLSDRDQSQRNNIWSVDIDSGDLKQITTFTDFDVHYPAIGPKDLVFEAGGLLYLLSLADDTYHAVDVKVVTDEATLLPRLENATDLIESVSLSPNGKRALFSARGDVFDVPAENGPVLDVTRTSGFAERYPAWSPDGKTAACWSDASGEYELMLMEIGKPETAKKVTSYGPGYRYQLYWSPDSKMLAFIDQAMKIHVYDTVKNRTMDVDQNRYMFEDGLEGFAPGWSPDSRYLAYRRDMSNQAGAICIFDTRDGKSHQVTSGYCNDNLPSFDPDGKYLYFVTNRTLDPSYSDLDNSWIYANTTNIAAASLTDDILSPLAPENDSTSVDTDAAKAGADDKKDKKGGDKDKKKAAPAETKITFDNFERRVVLLPPEAGNYGRVVGVAGKVVYLRRPNTGSGDKKSPVMYYDLEEREEKTIVDDAHMFEVSADGKRVLVQQKDTYAVVDLKADQKLDKTMPTGKLEMLVDPRAEWRQMFTDTWRFERDFFYDKGMHGVDWPGMRTRYGKLLDQAVTRWDANFVIGELIAELSSSHTYRGGGDTEHAEDIDVGYLGVDWELAGGAYRIQRIVRGAPWDTEVRSPLDMPGVAVKEGDYVLAVNGRPIDATKAPWGAFAGLADQTVDLTVNGKPSMDGARHVLVKTLDDETRLRHLEWIESNRKHVDEASGGKVGYIYVESTGIMGQTMLVRQFMAQFDKPGLIIDERFNSGGQIPDRFIELLNRKPLAFWAVRDGQTWQWPPVAAFGPKAMLINGWSGSGGDAFPDFFRKAGLGPLIGTRTWGGLIGISGAPSLIDGGYLTVPTFRMYDPSGKWFLEGHGVDPDIEVIEDPAQLAKGVDTQVERAIKEVMQAIAAGKPADPGRPAPEKR
ncbi:MAG TPA: PDZ domain-containing protein [Candidatus Krumholzibacteria bacterium]|nr:PDZ domain-containing protein [Candidatus Krumholzibacteria bacterium]